MVDARILNTLRKKSRGIGIMEDSKSILVMNAATVWRLEKRPRVAKPKESIVSEETKVSAAQFAILEPSCNQLKIDNMTVEMGGLDTVELIGPDGSARLDWDYLDIAKRLYGDVSFHMPALGTLPPWDKAVLVVSGDEIVAAIGVLTRRP